MVASHFWLSFVFPEILAYKMTTELISNSLKHAEFRAYELPEIGVNHLQLLAQFGAANEANPIDNIH